MKNIVFIKERNRLISGLCSYYLQQSISPEMKDDSEFVESLIDSAKDNLFQEYRLKLKNCVVLIDRTGLNDLSAEGKEVMIIKLSNDYISTTAENIKDAIEIKSELLEQIKRFKNGK